MTLPLLIHDTTSLWIFLFVGGASTLVLYQITNRYHWREPALLDFDWVDKQMPFWPKSVWVYFSEYIIFGACYFSLREWESLTRYFYSYMCILIFSCLVFALYPVTFPRIDYHLDNYPDNLSKRALLFLREKMDTPANCLPSLHVSSCFISSFAFWFESKFLFAVFFVWSLLVSVSTMTTKQHYFIDVWTSAILTLAVFWFFSAFVVFT